jgi:hypothetical protein
MKTIPERPSATQARRLTFNALSIGQIDPPPGLSEPEIIAIDRHLKTLLASAPFPSARRILGSEYFSPVKAVRSCTLCDKAVALISLDGEVSLVDASCDSDSELFHRRWTANVLFEHQCEAHQ